MPITYKINPGPATKIRSLLWYGLPQIMCMSALSKLRPSTSFEHLKNSKVVFVIVGWNIIVRTSVETMRRVFKELMPGFLSPNVRFSTKEKYDTQNKPKQATKIGGKRYPTIALEAKTEPEYNDSEPESM